MSNKVELTDSEIEEFQRAYNTCFDRDKDGTLNTTELGT